MSICVREMRLDEVGVVIDYFHSATADHLDRLGVDAARLPAPTKWQDHYRQDFARPIEDRHSYLVLWEADGEPLGFSTADKITFGREAYMHLHILQPDRRQSGFGSECVRRTAAIYFEKLKLAQLFCEPNAFNVAPNRTLQAVGFKYLRTYNTVPGPLNYHQAVTLWMLDAPPPAGHS
jgi:RimJ/RimL family protein N-acetyltransferase